jgi:hypothetical protein
MILISTRQPDLETYRVNTLEKADDAHMKFSGTPKDWFEQIPIRLPLAAPTLVY